jgi:uncharacterized Zn finger protein (UPF0148 family)
MKRVKTKESPCVTRIIEHNCPKCGKKFIIAPFHVYKHNGTVFCSYGCYNSYLTEIEEKMNVRRNRISGKEIIRQSKADIRNRLIADQIEKKKIELDEMIEKSRDSNNREVETK